MIGMKNQNFKNLILALEGLIQNSKKNKSS